MNNLTLQEKALRVIAVRDSSFLNGIDYVEVASEDQRQLRVFFIHPLPGEVDGIPAAGTLAAENFAIAGGERVKNIRVTQVTASGNTLLLTVNQAGDFSTYHLSLVTSVHDATVPAGYDPVLASILVNFKINCPNPLDCAAPATAGKRVENTADIDYLAKDYRSFRRLMLGRMSVLMPHWQERNPADQQIMLTELLAYVGDQLSYYQDAVATEAYLGTANQRRSLSRHARILDYRVHEGCNARTWVHVSVAPGSAADGASLPLGTRFLSADDHAPVRIHPDQFDGEIQSELVFESMHAQRVFSVHNEMQFYTWSHAFHCLPEGSVSAVLINDPPLALAVGDILLLEQVRDSGAQEDVAPNSALKHCVRITRRVSAIDPLTGVDLLEVHWHRQDALPFSLCLEAVVNGDSGPEWVTVSVARGNLAMADQGISVRGRPGLSPAVVSSEGGAYRPKLDFSGITYHENYQHSTAMGIPATAMLQQNPRHCRAAVALEDGSERWRVQSDLLASDRFATEFVVEREQDGSAYLRFGDDRQGREPSEGTAFQVFCRIGNGRAGNVGPLALRQVVTALEGVETVFNPLPAVGGQDPESAEAVRRFAPQAFRVQQRAVTEADWVAVAERHPQVQKAYAEFRWTGSWYTVFLTLDRFVVATENAVAPGTDNTQDAQFKTQMLAFLDPFRMAGYDLELRDPVMVSLEIELRVCLKPNYSRSDILNALVTAFSSRINNNGERGFFYPDGFTFGEPLYLSKIYQRALAIDGIASVTALVFKRWGKTDTGEIKAGTLRPAASEILRCASNPNLPEHGTIRFQVHEL